MSDAPAPTDTASPKIDLDAARKARREKQGPAPVLVFLERDWILPRAIPASVIDLIGQTAGGDFTAPVEAMKILLGPGTYDELITEAEAAGDPLEIDDVIFLLEEVLDRFGLKPGESPASRS